jgi:hypothetical protein
LSLFQVPFSVGGVSLRGTFDFFAAGVGGEDDEEDDELSLEEDEESLDELEEYERFLAI